MYRFPDQYIKKDKFEYSIILSFLKKVIEGITVPQAKWKFKKKSNHTYKQSRQKVGTRIPEITWKMARKAEAQRLKRS